MRPPTSTNWRWPHSVGIRLLAARPTTVFKGQNTWSPEKRVGALPGHRDKGALELAKFSHFKRLQCQAECRGRCLQFLQYQHIGSVGRIMEDRHAGSLGNNSFQELQPLPAQVAAERRP